ncbi:MAG: hypothetical protein PVH18_01515 [Chloroflexota bacterium]|jgi:tetratricopeptide (TPR) repeat protein
MAHKHIIYMMLVDAAARAGDAASLQAYLPLLEQLAARDDHRPYLAVARRALGVLCRLKEDYDEAKVQLNQALEVFEELGFHWQVGRTLADIAELALAQSDATVAGDYFSRALTKFEAMQAGPDAERTRAALETLG